MAVEKLSLSFDPALAREIRRQAKRAGMSLSAFMAQAGERETKLMKMRQLVGEFEAEHGAFTDEEMESVDRVWQASRSTQGRSSKRKSGSEGSGRSRERRQKKA